MFDTASFASATISDFCLIVEDLDRALVFYRDIVGFGLRRHAPGFADFATAGITLALWERRHLVEHVGIASRAAHDALRASIAAVQVDAPQQVEEIHRVLSRRGVVFLKQPQWYAWNAYACYFEDPDRHLWEIYAWGDGGHAGLLEIASVKGTML